MCKKIEVNIPFAEALAQMPHYAKFMKDVLSKKRKIDEGVVSLSTTYYAVIQKNFPMKIQDPLPIWVFELCLIERSSFDFS